ncbi:hypothetical protein D3C83_301570 [compost metagenome]
MKAALSPIRTRVFIDQYRMRRVFRIDVASASVSSRKCAVSAREIFGIPPGFSFSPAL